jgi:hypothetical protein
MTTKVLTGTYTAGYALKSPITTLSITATGYVEGNGVVSGSSAAYTIVNAGRVNSAMDGVYLADGGVIINGTPTRTTALIEGAYSAAAVRGAAGTVTNYGVIITPGGGTDTGVYLGAGGAVTNGSGVDLAASIEGGYGVWIRTAPGTVTNYGTIVGSNKTQAETFASGVYIDHGGAVTNGTNGATAALIEGFRGVYFRGAAGAVHNYGTISSPMAGSGQGVLLGDGGSVTNGSATDRIALIAGYQGISVKGAAGSVANFATIRGTGAFGVSLYAGGSVTNGAVNDRGALIQGYSGLHDHGAGVSANFGTIQGEGGAGSVGAFVGDGATLINGAANDPTALIEGYAGAYVGQFSTLTNFGTIEGAGGVAVALQSPGAKLVVEAGSVFEGSVTGDGGTLDLASGVGVLTGLFSSGGNVTVSGSMAATTFQTFGKVAVEAGATFTDTGAVTIAAGQTVNDAGTLTLGGAGMNSIVNAGLIETTGTGRFTLAGAVVNTGTLAAKGGILTANASVTGTGHATINGGTLDLKSSFNQNVTFSGTTGVLELAQSQTYTGNITGFSTTGGTSLDLVDIGFVSSTEATFSGTKTGGVLTVTDGTHTAHINLKGNYLSATFVASSDGHGGTIVVDPRARAQLPTATQSGAAHQFIAAMAGLGAGMSGAADVTGGVRTEALRPMLAAPRMA